MKIYLASQFSRSDELNDYRHQVEKMGIKVTSRWLTGDHEWTGTADTELPLEVMDRFASEDLDDITAADAFVCFTEPTGTGPARGGRHFEAGYAFALRKTMFIVGHRENVFYGLNRDWVFFAQEWRHAKDALSALQVMKRSYFPAGQIAQRLREYDGIE